jgi:toxin HigB-1
VIRSFACEETEKIFHGERSRKLPLEIQKTARRKLVFINAANSLNDLRAPYSNHLEALKEDRIGQHAIRINKQWRVCFVWRDRDATKVEINNHYQ